MSSSFGEQVHEALKRIERFGSFVSWGRVVSVPLGFEVDSIGPIGVPLTPDQAQSIKALCEPAPHGQGEKTVVDPNVRKCWRLDPGRFQLSTPMFLEQVDEILERVQRDLGLESQKIEARLDHLLLYEPGCFFLPHKDGEKDRRMVATLVLSPPSSFKGGELVVRHDGDERVLDFGGGCDFAHLHYAAFYADCEHEVKPVVQGYRISLIYNLVLANSRQKTSAPSQRKHVTEVAEELRRWPNEGPRLMAFLMEHEYTQSGLGWDSLKGFDRAKAEVLREAAGAAACEVALALLTLHQTGEAIESSSRRRSWHVEESQPKMGEIYEETLLADHWVDERNGSKVEGALPVETSEIFPADRLLQVKPEEEFQGYTGNEGLTLDRWYRHGTLLVWPKRRTFEIQVDRGRDAAVNHLEGLLGEWLRFPSSGPSTESSRLKEQAEQFALAVIKRWKSASRTPTWARTLTPETSTRLAEVLSTLRNPDLIKCYLEEIAASEGAAIPESLIDAMESLDLATFRDSLHAVFATSTTASFPRNAWTLRSLFASRAESPERTRLLQQFARDALSGLRLWERDYERVGWYSAIPPDRDSILASFMEAFGAAAADDIPRLVEFVGEFPRQYPLSPVIAAAWSLLDKQHPEDPNRPWSPALLDWLDRCVEELGALVAQPPLPPSDFRRDSRVTCKCRSCQEVRAFLDDPAAESHHVKAALATRRHVEDTIDKDRLDLACTTLRTSSPHTLVLRKTTDSYALRMKIYKLNLDELEAMRMIRQRRGSALSTLHRLDPLRPKKRPPTNL